MGVVGYSVCICFAPCTKIIELRKFSKVSLSDPLLFMRNICALHDWERHTSSLAGRAQSSPCSIRQPSASSSASRLICSCYGVQVFYWKLDLQTPTSYTGKIYSSIDKKRLGLVKLRPQSSDEHIKGEHTTAFVPLLTTFYMAILER